MKLFPARWLQANPSYGCFLMGGNWYRVLNIGIDSLEYQVEGAKTKSPIEGMMKAAYEAGRLSGDIWGRSLIAMQSIAVFKAIRNYLSFIALIIALLALLISSGK